VRPHLLPVAAILVLAGCSGHDAHVIIERTVPIDAPLGYAQVMIKMDKGDTISWKWSVEDDRRVLFTVHTRDPYRLLYDHEGSSGSHSFTATSTDSFAVYWERDERVPHTLHYRITGEGVVDRDGQNVPPM
jgi:hypothetical protein